MTQEMPSITLVARTEEIGDWIAQCARQELSFGDLCSRVAARGYRTTSLYEMVCAAEQQFAQALPRRPDTSLIKRITQPGAKS